MQRGVGALMMGVVAVAALALSGCGAADPDPASIAAGRDHSLYSGPLLGRHELIASAAIDNPTSRPLRLVSVTAADGYNVTVEDALAVPLHSPDSPQETGILGVLRWPRDAGEHDSSFNVLKHAQDAAGFTLPAHSKEQWMVTLRLRQTDDAKSMRTAGTTITYSLNGHAYTVTNPTALCFTAKTDTKACTDDTRL